MHRVKSGSVGGSIESPGWRLYDGNGLRENRFRVDFNPDLTDRPEVIVALSGVDLIHGNNHRLTVHAENISKEGFEVVFRTWADTRVYSATASWLAVTP